MAFIDSRMVNGPDGKNVFDSLNDHASSLADKTKQLNTQFINVLYPPAPLVACKGDGVTDDTTAIQAMINYFGANGGRLYFPQPSNYYKITSPLNLLNPILNSWGTLEIFGESVLNTQIKLENNAATEALKYDNGTKKVDVANCSTTNGSAIVTTTGNFITSGIEVGMFIQLSNMPMTAVVNSVDSATQITLNKTATATGSGSTARFYKLVTNTHRLIIRDLYIKNSYAYSAFTSWHPATGLKLWGTHDSIIENVRIEGFTKGLHSLGGFLNRYEMVNTNKCYDGYELEYACFATNIIKPICAETGANSGGYPIKAINTASIKIDNIALEVNKRGILLEGVRGFDIGGGNIETTSYDLSIELKGLSNIDSSDETFWTSGGVIRGLRFYESIGVLFKNGVKSVKFEGNSFEGKPTSFTVSASSCINSSGDYAYIKDIEYGNNRYYAGGEPNRHILTGTLASAQSISQNGKKYASAIPYYGKYWKVGDMVYNSAPIAGGYLGWVCVSASDGVNDGSAVWKGFGAIQA